MRIATHVLAYNVSRFINPVLRNMAPFVDRIYVAHPRRPWAYNSNSRASKTNPTHIDELSALLDGSKIEIIEGDWLNEESMRNTCLQRAREEGFDWLLIQDADEFYPEETWQQIRRVLSQASSEDHLTTTWYNFWKSSHYVLVNSATGIKESNAGFAIRCRPGLEFVNKRRSNALSSRVIDCPCFHYGYVMSDNEMIEKISTWSHADEIKALWLRLKWLNWNFSTRNLHPLFPTSWVNAVRFPMPQPDFAEEFALPVVTNRSVSWADLILDNGYNARAGLHALARSMKAVTMGGWKSRK
jgi:hypothetical protein